MNTVLITGASGLLGSNLIPQAAQAYEVYGISRSASGTLPHGHHRSIDLLDHAQTLRCLNEIKPAIVVHCAAVTDVDDCEMDLELAKILNAEVPRSLAEWCERHVSRLVYISTDSVFDGERGSYCEDDLSGPLNNYARTKLAGEIWVRDANPSALILRTNFYGWSHKKTPSLAEWMLSNLAIGKYFQAFTDVRFNPLLVNDLSKIILRLIRCAAHGTFHLGASESCSKYEFALQLASEFGYSSEMVIPSSVDLFPFKAKRPKNTSLAVAKVSRYLGEEMPGIADGLREFRRLFGNGFLAELKRESFPGVNSPLAAR